MLYFSEWTGISSTTHLNGTGGTNNGTQVNYVRDIFLGGVYDNSNNWREEIAIPILK